MHIIILFKLRAKEQNAFRKKKKNYSRVAHLVFVQLQGMHFIWLHFCVYIIMMIDDLNLT